MKTTWHGPAHSPRCPAPPAYTHATADGDYRQNICRGQRSTLKAPHQAVFSSLFYKICTSSWRGVGGWGLFVRLGAWDGRRDARRVLERHKEVDEAGWPRTLLLIQLFSSRRDYSHSSPLYGEVPRWITGMHASRQGHHTCVRGKAWQWAQWTMLRCVRVCIHSLNVRTAASLHGFSEATGGWGLAQRYVWQVLRCKALHQQCCLRGLDILKCCSVRSHHLIHSQHVYRACCRLRINAQYLCLCAHCNIPKISSCA